MSDWEFIKLLYKYLRPHIYRYLGILLLMVYAGFYVTLEPYLIKLIVDNVESFSGPREDLLRHIMPTILLFILASSGVTFTWQGKHWIESKIVPEMEVGISMHIFEYLQHQSHRYFQTQLAGKLSNKIADLHSAIDRILNIFSHFFRTIVGIIGTVLLMYIVQPMFALVILIWSILFIVLSAIFVRSLEPYTIRRADQKSNTFGGIVDCLSNMMTVRLFARHKYESDKQKESFKAYVDYDRMLRYRQIIIWTILGLFATALLGIMLVLLVYFYSKKWIHIGDFAFIIINSVNIIENLFYFNEFISEFISKWGTAKNGAEILSQPHEIKDKPNAVKLVLKRGTVEFKNVTFRYAKKKLFSDLSIKIFGGQKIGLVGYSGSGKSSFVNLLTRLFDIESGEILIDDQNIQDVTQQSLHESISYIPQEPVLFHRTLEENIRYGKLNATKEEIYKAAQMAYAHSFIMNLPEQYSTPVGERGLKLSGSQRQRIAIARAYLKDVPILIMDEATSALDSTTENYIQKSLQNLMVGKTVFVVAHRLSTLLSMDRILVFSNGKIIEDGSHEELIKSNGTYASLWKSQVNGFIGKKA